jgi:hypothetical protein
MLYDIFMTSLASAILATLSLTDRYAGGRVRTKKKNDGIS